MTFQDRISPQFSIQHALYEAQMEEINEALSPIQNSLDLSKPSQVFCGQCDPRTNHLLTKPIFNDLLIDKQLSWIPHKDKKSNIIKGEFVLDRFWCSNFALFPDCSHLAKAAALKLVQRLGQFGCSKFAHVASEASFKLGKSFLTGKCRWATEKDLSQKCTFVATLAVLSESLDSSTKIRVCQIPNRPMFIRQLGTSRTLNSFIRKTQLKMSSLNLFYLAHTISVNMIFLDFQECFNSLKLSEQTSLQNIIYCLKTSQNLPSYNLKHSDGQVHPLVLTHASFGFCDIPRFTQRSVEKLVDVYVENKKCSTIDPDILQDLRFICHTLTWVDDSVIPACYWRVIQWAEKQGRFSPLSSCSCVSQCREWNCSTRSLTQQDVDKFHTYIQRETSSYLLTVARAMVEVSNFSSFTIKHYKSVGVDLQDKLDKSGLLTPKGVIDPRLQTLIASRPTGAQIQSEIQRNKKLKMKSSPVEEEAGMGEKVSQLGKSYQNGQVFLKNPSVYLAYFHQGHKRKSPKFSTHEELTLWRAENKIQVCRLTITSFLAQQFDFSGKHLALVRTYLKHALRIHLSFGISDWDREASKEVVDIFDKGVLAYFLICHRGLPRSNLFLNPATGYFLICTGDGGRDLHGVTVSLVSYFRLNGIYRAKAHNLTQDTYVNHVSMREQIHQVELLASLKMVDHSFQQLSDLERLGLSLPAENVLYITDSRYVLLILRSLPQYYNQKICTLATRIQQTLASRKLDPWKSFAFIMQHELPYMNQKKNTNTNTDTNTNTNTDTNTNTNTKANTNTNTETNKKHRQRFHSDILSKTRGTTASRDSILLDFHLLQCVDWLEMDPMEWTFLRRDTILPVLSDETLIRDVGANPDNLTQLKDFLNKKKSIQHFSTFLQGRSSLGRTPTGLGHQDNHDDHGDHPYAGHEDDEDSTSGERELTVQQGINENNYLIDFLQGSPHDLQNQSDDHQDNGDDDNGDDDDDDDGEEGWRKCGAASSPPAAPAQGIESRVAPTGSLENHHQDGDEDDDHKHHDDHDVERVGRSGTSMPTVDSTLGDQPRTSLTHSIDSPHHGDDDKVPHGDHADDNGNGDGDDDEKATEDAGRTRWRQQIQHLVSRKILYKLGNRSVLCILGWANFYIRRLKILINLPDDKKIEMRRVLRSRLAQSKKSFHPYCGKILCNPRTSKCGMHLSLQIPEMSLTDSKLKMEKHFLFSGPVKGRHMLGNYEAVLTSQPVSSCFENFVYDPSIRIMIFDQLCCLFTLSTTIKGFQLQTLKRPNGPLYIACGRKQRCYLTSIIYEPRLRVIDPKSIFFKLCVTTAHAASLGKSPQETKAFFLGLGIIAPSLNHHIKLSTAECFSCRLNQAFEARSNYLMQSLEPSPTGRLISISKADSSFSHVCVDLSGQYFYMSNNRQRQGIYFLMCVSSHFCGESKIIPIRDKSINSILTGLKTLAYGSSTKLQVCLFDAGTEFLRYVNQISPMEATIQQEPLADKWYKSLFRNTVQTNLEQHGIFLQYGKARHAAVSVVENKIKELKRAFKSFKIFRKSPYPVDIFKIHLILSIVHYVLETRPICIVGTQIYSLQDFRMLFFKGGQLANSECGIPLKSKDVTLEYQRLHDLHNQVTSSLLAHHIPSLLKTHHPRETYKQSISVEELRQNDIIFDQVGFAETGSISGNLSRVIQKSQSQRFCLIQKCVQGNGKIKQICLSRPCEYLSFICHGDKETIIFDPQYALFDFDEHLQRPSKATTIYNIPPCHQGNDQQNQQNQMIQSNPIQSNPIQSNPIQSKPIQSKSAKSDDPTPPRFSKRGRLLKPPNQWKY